MRESRTQENLKFEKFFSFVRKEAEKKNAIFFIDSGEGDAVEMKEIECETLFGWLIPNAFVEEFEAQYKQGVVASKWDRFTCFADWEINSFGRPQISFSQLG